MSISDFSVSIGIDSGNARNTERVLKTLQKIKELDKKMQTSKLAKNLADFDLTKMSKDAGFDELRERLTVANDSLRDMLKKVDTMDEAFKTGGAIGEKVEEFMEQVRQQLDTAIDTIESKVDGVKRNVGNNLKKVRDKIDEVNNGIESVLVDMARKEDTEKLHARLDKAVTLWSSELNDVLDQTLTPIPQNLIQLIRDNLVSKVEHVGRETQLAMVDMRKAMQDLAGGLSKNASMDDLKKELQAVHDTLRTVRILVTDKLTESMKKRKQQPPPGGPPPIPPGREDVARPPPAAPTTTVPVSEKASPTWRVTFNNLGRPVVSTTKEGFLKTIPPPEEFREMVEAKRFGELSPAMMDKINEFLKREGLEIVDAVKEEIRELKKDEKVKGESVLSEDDVK